MPVFLMMKPKTGEGFLLKSKKINTRLVNIESGKLKMVQRNQEDLIRQIEELKLIFPELRGSMEQNPSHFNEKFDGISQRLD